nr:hypothetical protein Iba_chr02cCG4910 [Ipomoea batatas]
MSRPSKAPSQNSVTEPCKEGLSFRSRERDQIRPSMQSAKGIEASFDCKTPPVEQGRIADLPQELTVGAGSLHLDVGSSPPGAVVSQVAERNKLAGKCNSKSSNARPPSSIAVLSYFDLPRSSAVYAYSPEDIADGFFLFPCGRCEP